MSHNPRPGTASPSRSSLSSSHMRRPGEGAWVIPSSAQDKLAAFKEWQRENTGLQLIAFSQLFFSTQTVCVKILQDENKMPVMELVFVRMVITASGCFIWLKSTGDPNPFLGPPEVRKLLVLRGTLGFCGLTGIYNSLRALSLADATTLSFLSPTVTAILGYVALNEALGRKEIISGLISLFGVILISRPPFIFGAISDPAEHYHYGISPESASRAGWSGSAADKVINDAAAGLNDVVTAEQRMVAVGFALFGVLGASGAYTTIRAIGKRAHPLHSIAYFAVCCTVASTLVMLMLRIQIVVPNTFLGWTMLLGVGVSGLLAQIFVTMGLQREKAGRASLVMYLQILYSLFFERVIFNKYPSPLSLLGTIIILASALYVAFSGQKAKPDDIEFQALATDDPDHGSLQAPRARRRPSRISLAAAPFGTDVNFDRELRGADLDAKVASPEKLERKRSSGPI